MEKLILYSFNTYIITLFLLNIYNKCNIKADSKAEQYIQNLSPQQFLKYIKDIRIATFLRNIYHNTNQRILDYLKSFTNGY